MKRDTLRHHVKHMHEAKNHHICHICAKAFTWKNDLERHVQKHSECEETRIYCNICGLTYKNEASLRTHMFNHEDEGKSFPCPKCPKICINRNALKGHIQLVHNYKTYPCDECDKVFRREILLKVRYCDGFIQVSRGHWTGYFTFCRSTRHHIWECICINAPTVPPRSNPRYTRINTAETCIRTYWAPFNWRIQIRQISKSIKRVWAVHFLVFFISIDQHLFSSILFYLKIHAKLQMMIINVDNIRRIA